MKGISKAVLLTSLLATQVFAMDASQKKYSDVKNFMHDLVRTHPNTVRSVTIGESDSGDALEGVAIGDGPVHNLVVATHHGNEYGSTEVGMAVAASLASKPIADQTVYVVPVLNIAGYNDKNREEQDKDGNYNDPNRDYPGPCGTEGPHHLKSTSALAKFIDREAIVTSATLHTYYPAVVYPWGFAASDLTTPYEDLFKKIVKNATEVSHYETGNSTAVIYPASGTYEDYAFWRSGVWSILFELGTSHHPSQQDIDKMIRLNVPGIRKMLEEAPKARAENHEFTSSCLRRNWLTKLGIKYDKHDE
jgi:carboxypeptidase T